MTILTAILTALSSGVGGGLIGSITGLFKQNFERKERVEMARIQLERELAEYGNDEAEREHALTILERGGELEVQKVMTESEAEIEVAQQKTLNSATVAEFKKLNTSPWMDNYRASIRPSLAIWMTILFTAMLIWAFCIYSDELTASEGKAILLGLFATLEFIVSSVVTFYYVSRRNLAPKI